MQPLHNERAKFVTLLLSLFFLIQVSAQEQFTIQGNAFDISDKLPLPYLMVINKSTNHGVFADAAGNFTIRAAPNDTIILSALGFKLKTLSFADSIGSRKVTLSIPMEKLFYSLRTIPVFPIRSLNEIQKDIEHLGVRNTYTTHDIDAFQSPITYLYERFSRFGKSKRKVAQLENEDLKRDILKDLFRLYIKYDIIELNDDEFDDFIRYLNFSDNFMQTATQLELVMAIKGKYESYQYRWK